MTDSKRYKIKITMDDEKKIHVKEITEENLKEFKRDLLRDEEDRLIDLSIYSPEANWIINNQSISYIEIKEIKKKSSEEEYDIS